LKRLKKPGKGRNKPKIKDLGFGCAPHLAGKMPMSPSDLSTPNNKKVPRATATVPPRNPHQSNTVNLSPCRRRACTKRKPTVIHSRGLKQSASIPGNGVADQPSFDCLLVRNHAAAPANQATEQTTNATDRANGETSLRFEAFISDKITCMNNCRSSRR
jgi:hypothetical protein